MALKPESLSPPSKQSHGKQAPQIYHLRYICCFCHSYICVCYTFVSVYSKPMSTCYPRHSSTAAEKQELVIKLYQQRAINRKQQNLSAGICPLSFFQTTTGFGVPETWHSSSTSVSCITALSRGVFTNSGSTHTRTHTHTHTHCGSRSSRRYSYPVVADGGVKVFRLEDKDL